MIQKIWTHLTTHWITTLKGIVYLTFVVMYVTKQIDVKEFGVAVTTIMGINALFQKDANKVQSKPGK